MTAPGAQPEHAVARAVQRLREGGVVAFPTETVYGLGADARNPHAVARVFALKGRPPHNPLIVHVADERGAAALAAPGAWSPAASALARAFWPGPLTIVVRRAACIPDLVTGGGQTVGLRCPDHAMAMTLLRGFGGPLVGPSANRSGEISPTEASHVRESFPEDEVMVLDGGPCRIGIESTVVAVDEGSPRVLRLGAVSAEQIGAALGVEAPRPLGRASAAADGGPMPSPGMLASHYAPRARAALAERATLADRAAEAASAGERCAAIVIDATSTHALRARGVTTVIVMPGEARAYSARLYAALREADAAAPTLILIERPPDGAGGALGSGADPLWRAVLDRLTRACAPRG